MNGFALQPNFTAYLAEYVTDPNYWVVATGDFNRDGMTDLVWRHHVDSSACIAYWLMSPANPLSRLSSGCIVATGPDASWQIVAPK